MLQIPKLMAGFDHPHPFQMKPQVTPVTGSRFGSGDCHRSGLPWRFAGSLSAVAVADFAVAATWRAMHDTDLYMSGTVDSEPVARDEAIAMLWQQQRSQLVRLAVGLTGDRDVAEEIVQEAFAARSRTTPAFRSTSLRRR
jgi:hypothetical protein